MGLRPHHLEALLRDVGRQQRRTKTVRRACLTLSALTLATLAAVAVDAALGLDDGAMAMTSAGIVIMGVLSAALLVRTGLSRRCDPRATAAWIERRATVADNALITAVEMLAGDRRDGLAELAIRRGDDAAALLRGGTWVDRRPARRALTVLLAMMLLVGGGVALWPDGASALRAGLRRLALPWAGHPPYTRLTFDVAVSPAPAPRGGPAMVTAHIRSPDGIPPRTADLVWLGAPNRRVGMTRLAGHSGVFQLPIERATSAAFVIDTADGRSEAHQLTIIDAPNVVAATVHMIPPAYTGRSPWSAPLADGADITALAGSRATLMIEATEPISRGAILFAAVGGQTDPRLPLRLDPAAPRRATADLLLARDMSGHVVVTGLDGHDSTPLAFHIRVLADHPPAVSIGAPADGVGAPAGWPIDLLARAEDDVAVASVGLTLRVNAATQPAPALDGAAAGEGVWTGMTTIDAEGLRLTAGDLLELRAHVHDALTPFPQRGESAPVRVRIISAEEYARTMRARYTRDAALAEVRRLRSVLQRLAAQRERLGHGLRSVAEEGSGNAVADPSLRREAEATARGSNEAASWMRRRGTGPRVFEFEGAYGEALEAEAKRLEEWASAARDLLAADDGSAMPGARAAAQRLMALSGTITDGSAMLDAAQEAIEQSGELSPTANETGSGAGRASGSGDARQVLGPHALDPLPRDAGMVKESTDSPRTMSNGSSSGRSDATPRVDEDDPSTRRAPNEPERLTTPATRPGGLIEPVLTGVPRRYAAQAAAYFQRLAEDSR